MSVMIGIPAFDESKTISKIITKAKVYGTVVVVDDGSVDNTYKLAQEAGATIISHIKNMGYGKSISDLFNYAKNKDCSILVILDGDGQHNPDEIPNFLKAIENTDVVIGNRFIGKHNTPNYRKFGIKVISKFNKLGDSQCGFRAFNHKAINLLANNLHETNMGASLEVLSLTQSFNLKISEISCEITYGQEKHSQNPFSQGFDLLLSFIWFIVWKKPSRTLLPLGLAFLLISAISGAQTINLYTQSHYIVQSWALFTLTSLLCTMIIFNTLIFVLVFKNKKVNDT